MAAPRKPAPSIEELALVISTASAATLAREPQTLFEGAISPPLRRALIAVGIVYSGDATRGLALLQNALTPTLGEHRAFFADVFVGLLIIRSNFSQAATVLRGVPRNVRRELSVSLMAADALVELESGSRAKAVKLLLRALNEWQTLTEPALRMRAASRIAYAAFWLRDYALAQRFATETITAAESLKAFRPAAHGYSILVAIAHYTLKDKELCYHYCDRLQGSAAAIPDASLQRYALVVDAWAAFEFGDLMRFARDHSRLLQRPFPEQLSEGFAASIMDGIALALNGKFLAAANLLKAQHPRVHQFVRSERAVHLAVQAVCQFGILNDDEARRLSRESISASTGWRDARSIGADAHDAAMARLLAVSVCYYLGDIERARRALPRAIDPTRTFLGALGPRHIRLSAVPASFHGYALLLIAALERRAKDLPEACLSQKEREVLVALLGGHSKNSVASALGKSAHTIARQCESIYKKLGVKNRAELILKASELGIGPFQRSRDGNTKSDERMFDSDGLSMQP